MAGAVTASINDGSAMFYNPAGLADTKKFSAMGGITFLIPNQEFTGSNPYPGSNYSADGKSMIFFPMNLYVTAPIADKVTLSFGSWFPFGLTTAWENPDQYAGRYISKRAELRHFAFGLQLAVRATDWLAIGAGPELRVSDVKLFQSIGALNPYTNRFGDVAHVQIVSDGMEMALSFGAGIQLKPTERLRLGLTYHGSVDQDYTGEATFFSRSSGYADFDARVAAGLPLNKPVSVETAIQFPAMWMMGISYDFTDCFRVEFNANYTEWDIFKETVLKFATVDNKPIPTRTIPQNYENTWAYRVGLKYNLGETTEFMAGFVYDQTPQPDETTGPLLPDANRTGYTLGASFETLKHIFMDVSVMALFFHERTTTTNDNNFNGTYKTFVWIPTLGLRMSF
jgi:long-chain fatty acid transport protein